MKKKMTSILLGVSMILGLFTGCAGKEEKIVLTIYAQYSDDDSIIPYDYAAEAVKEKFPNVELKLIVQEQDDGATLDKLASIGQLPDIFQANTNIINSLRKSNQVMAVDDVAEETGYIAKVADWNKNLLYSDDGHMYCFPYAGNEYVLWYYNKEVFEKYNLEVPTTFEELENCVRVFRSNGVVPLALMGNEGWVSTAMYDVIATRYDASGIKGLDDKTSQVTDSAYEKAAKQLEYFVKLGLFEDDVLSVNYTSASEMFFSGNAAMFINGQWFIEEAVARMGDNADWMYYPSYSEEAYESSKYAFSGGGSISGYSVNPDSKNAKLAAEVAEFIAEKYCEVKVTQRNNPLVAIETGLENSQTYPAMMEKLLDTIPKMTSTTKFAWGINDNKLYGIITTNSQQFLAGKYSADEFMEALLRLSNY